METIQDTHKSLTRDFKISWHIYKENWKTYVKFILLGYLLAGVLLFIITYISVTILQSLYGNVIDFLQDEEMVLRYQIMMNIPFMSFIFAFFGATYGLSYDIISSGDEFAELKTAISYFRKRGWQYIVISIISSIFPIINTTILYAFIQSSRLIEVLPWLNYVIKIVLIIAGILWSTSLSLCFPSVTAQGSIKQALYENFYILKKHPKRIFKSIGGFYIISSTPQIITLILGEISSEELPTLNYFLIVIVMLCILILFSVLLNPLSAILTTHVYNDYVEEIPEDRRNVQIPEDHIRIDNPF